MSRNHHKLEEIKIIVGKTNANELISLSESKIRGIKIIGSCDNREIVKIISSYPEVIFHLSENPIGLF